MTVCETPTNSTGRPLVQHAYIAKMKPIAAGGYSISFPDIPGCITKGGDSEVALRNAEAILQATLTAMKREGQALPRASSMAELAAAERVDGVAAGVWLLVALDYGDVQ